MAQLPETISKEDLLKAMNDRFRQWMDMYIDPNVPVSNLYEELCCSIFSGDPESDFPSDDPILKMQVRFCDICDAANLGFTAWDLNERHGDEPVPGYWNAWEDFIDGIGNATFPEMCCYARAWKKKLEQAGHKSDWVDECLDTYEKDWYK